MKKLEYDPYEFKTKEVDGVKIYYKDIPLAPCVQIRWSIKNGAMHDIKGKEGTAHFLEHMLFDGNPMFPKKTDIDIFSRKYLLDSINAYTSFYNTVLTCKFLAKNTDTALDAIYNIVYKPFLKEDDIEHERKVITQEMWGYLINPAHIEYLKKLNANVFQSIETKKRMTSPGGWIDTVASIQKDDLQNAHKSYVKENTHVVLAGCITEELLQKIEAVIKNIPSGNTNTELNIPDKIIQATERSWTKTYTDIGISEKKQSTLSILRLLERSASTDAVLGLTTDLLYYLLIKKLRQENSWCYSVGVNFQERPDYTNQSIEVKVSPENAKDAENIIWKTIEDLINKQYVEDFEMNKQTSIDSLLARERVSGQIADGAEFNLNIDKKIETLTETIDNIEKVMYEDVINHLSLNFKKTDVFTELIIPSEEVITI
ncbi:MAG: pitrilysin family protein [bacterium]